MYGFRTFILALTVAGPLAAAVPPGGGDRATGVHDIEAFRHMLFRRHVVCNDAALRGEMPHVLARACAQNFLALKLSFVPGATLERFGGLQPEERAQVNAAGYAGFRAWLSSQVTGATGRR
jgi:hypothetical protein